MRGPRSRSPAQLQAECDAFNARFAIGAEIHVWTGPIEGAPAVRIVREPGAAVLSGHTAVVYVAGGGGCIALSHVRELGAGDDRYLPPEVFKPFRGEVAARARRFIDYLDRILPEASNDGTQSFAAYVACAALLGVIRADTQDRATAIAHVLAKLALVDLAAESRPRLTATVAAVADALASRLTEEAGDHG